MNRWTTRWRIGSRWRTVLAGLAIVAAVVVSVLLALPVPPAGPDHPGTVTLSPASAKLHCIQDAEWSPDGRRVAVLGYSGGCPLIALHAAASEGAVGVYDATTGALRVRFQPDTAIRATLERTAAHIAHPIIQYQSLLWRRDSAMLALSFRVSSDDAIDQGNAANEGLIEGLFLSAADGSRSAVFMHPLALGERADGAWNVRTGAYLAAPAGGALAALSYTWNAAGGLVARDPLALDGTPQVGASGTVGLPDGGATFSIWQPAEIVRESEGAASAGTTRNVFVYRTSFASWSPDGVYLAPSLGLSARLQPEGQPGPDAQMLRALGVSGLPLLPVRDAGLATALGRQSLLATDQSNGPMSVAWSLDGRMLAVQLVPAEPGAESSETDHALIVYDCATGKPLTALVPSGLPSGAAASLAGATLLRWSSDGTHLLLYDAALGTMTLWGPGKVPKR